VTISLETNSFMLGQSSLSCYVVMQHITVMQYNIQLCNTIYSYAIQYTVMQYNIQLCNTHLCNIQYAVMQVHITTVICSYKISYTTTYILYMYILHNTI